MNRYKKNNIIIVMLSAMILLLSAALIYFMFFYEDGSYTIINTNSHTDYKEIKDENIKNTFTDVVKNNKLENIAKLEEDIDSFNNLSNKKKIDIGYYGVIDDITDPYSTGIDADLIDNYFKDTFKDNIYIDKEEGIYCVCGNILFKYDINSNKYIYNEDHLGHGFTYVENYYSKVIDVKNNDNSYIVTEVKLWNKVSEAGDEDFITKAYDSYSDAIDESNPLFEIEIDNPDITKTSYYYTEQKLYNNLDSYVNKMNKYVYTFEKINNKYLLVSFEYKKI